MHLNVINITFLNCSDNEKDVGSNKEIIRGGVEDTRLEAKAKDTKKIRGQGQGQPFRGQTLSRPRTGMLEAKHQGHSRKCSPKKKKCSPKRITDGGSRGEAPSDRRLWGLGAKPPAVGRFFVIFWKKAILMPLNYILRMFRACYVALSPKWVGGDKKWVGGDKRGS